jgi:hypothetical protein
MSSTKSRISTPEQIPGERGSKTPSRIFGKQRAAKPRALSSYCRIGDDGFIALVSARAKHCLQLDMRPNLYGNDFSERMCCNRNGRFQ